VDRAELRGQLVMNYPSPQIEESPHWLAIVETAGYARPVRSPKHVRVRARAGVDTCHVDLAPGRAVLDQWAAEGSCHTIDHREPNVSGWFPGRVNAIESHRPR
jgi:hypothetical protein